MTCIKSCATFLKIQWFSHSHLEKNESGIHVSVCLEVENLSMNEMSVKSTPLNPPQHHHKYLWNNNFSRITCKHVHKEVDEDFILIRQKTALLDTKCWVYLNTVFMLLAVVVQLLTSPNTMSKYSTHNNVGSIYTGLYKCVSILVWCLQS